MKKWLVISMCVVLLITTLNGCGASQTPKIGVAFGVGPAARWPQEQQYMKEYAKQLNVDIELRLNTDEAVKPLAEDCIELIDSGIDVLIVRPRDITAMKEVVAYAKEKKVKIISYASLIEGQQVDQFVGYDCEYIGQRLGGYLSEIVTSGDYILLWGEPRDRNVEDIYRGAMKSLDPIKGDINIILAAGVLNWSPEEAKRMVKEAVVANGNHVDAILAFNDKLAGASAEAIAELGITEPVVITGMDAEVDALKRIVEGSQSCTIYMDLETLAHAAVDEAINLAKNKDINVNYELDNGSGTPIPSYLLAGQFVNQANLDRVLIESGYFTASQIYGTMDQD